MVASSMVMISVSQEGWTPLSTGSVVLEFVILGVGLWVAFKLSDWRRTRALRSARARLRDLLASAPTSH